MVFEKCSPRKGTETRNLCISNTVISYLRNAVPARGRKPGIARYTWLIVRLFEKCSPRKGTETWIRKSGAWEMQRIWEMQSPQGDGNHIWETFNICASNLRNAVPARGRKLISDDYQWTVFEFEKCSPRKGTETCFSSLSHHLSLWNLRNAVPARGRKPSESFQ